MDRGVQLCHRLPRDVDPEQQGRPGRLQPRHRPDRCQRRRVRARAARHRPRRRCLRQLLGAAITSPTRVLETARRGWRPADRPSCTSVRRTRRRAAGYDRQLRRPAPAGRTCSPARAASTGTSSLNNTADPVASNLVWSRPTPPATSASLAPPDRPGRRSGQHARGAQIHSPTRSSTPGSSEAPSGDRPHHCGDRRTDDDHGDQRRPCAMRRSPRHRRRRRGRRSPGGGRGRTCSGR